MSYVKGMVITWLAFSALATGVTWLVIAHPENMLLAGLATLGLMILLPVGFCLSGLVGYKLRPMTSTIASDRGWSPERLPHKSQQTVGIRPGMASGNTQLILVPRHGVLVGTTTIILTTQPATVTARAKPLKSTQSVAAPASSARNRFSVTVSAD